MNRKEIAQELLAKLKKYEELKIESAKVSKDIYNLEQDLYDEMDGSTDEAIKIEGIEFKPMLETDYALSDEYKGGKWDEIGVFFQWLKSIGEDGLIKTKETVHPNTRKAYLKSYVDSGNELPDFIQEKYIQRIKYNKSAIARMVKQDNERLGT